jgi:hypothetical protein
VWTKHAIYKLHLNLEPAFDHDPLNINLFLNWALMWCDGLDLTGCAGENSHPKGTIRNQDRISNFLKKKIHIYRDRKVLELH